MKSALLAQNDSLVIENLKQNVGRSVFDLSHSTTFPIDVDGAILPICCLETVPSDSFEISCECLLRQLSPLTVPLMANFRLNTAWFWCDNRLGWKKWDRFMTGGRSGNEVYELPRVFNIECYPEDSNDNADKKRALVDSYLNKAGDIDYFPIAKALHSYFGISTNQKIRTKTYSGVDLPRYSSEPSEDDLPLAFPFFDYQIICRDFYTNVDRLAQKYTPLNADNALYPFNDWAYDNLFPVDDDEFRLVDGIQKKCGFHSGDDSEHSSEFYGCYLDKVRYHDVRPDYFTSSKKAPLRGDEPAITMSSSKITLPSGTELDLDKVHLKNSLGFNQNGITVNAMYPNGSGGSTGSQVIVNKNSSDVVTSFAIPSEGDFTEAVAQANLSEIDSGKVTIANDVEVTGIFQTSTTAAELRLLSQLTIWKELNMLHEPAYNDFLNAHFDGVSVGESAIEKPQYIGGTSQVISINEILQTSQTTKGESDASPLGTQGAVAMSLANNYVGKYYCNNYGYLIGVAYIITDMYYEPAIPRWSSRRTKEDFYSPEFANLSMQATLNKEIFASNNEEWNNTPWGYTGAFDELRSIPNRIAGDLLNDDYTDLQAWVIRRHMDNDNLPSMSTSWLSLKDNVDKTYIWQVPTMPAFMLQCANYIKAVRPLPKVAIPKAL